MPVQLFASITEIGQQAWDTLFAGSYPFTRYHFLAALEQGGSVDTDTAGGSGWQSQHLALTTDNGKLLAVMPAYLKQHSYGEYLFDWQFARAYQHYGLKYYPKLVNAIPFTPAQGPRMAIAANADNAAVFKALHSGITELIAKQQLSQFQSLYCTAQEAALWQQQGLLLRHDVQFQWYNRNYQSFTDFLATLTSRKRKQLRKERERVQLQGIRFVTLSGASLDPNRNSTLWRQFYAFYCATYQKRSGHQGYLTLNTFLLWAQQLAAQMVLFAAYHGDQLVAAALCFRSDDTLYGRYWGASAAYDSLHFECCYYQGIEYC
ncbi:MAG: GNAT family N-acetyltransferase, partial [Rheinheimera sp.]|nr:GNAT family N-acetyltransferase [Rheinheimera sp.]